MSNRGPNSPLGAFLQALEEEQIPCILIGGMAAIEQGAPVTTIDYDFWLPLPERQYVRILAIIKKLGGTVIARTFYELEDGTQINAVFKPDGLRSFATEFKCCRRITMGGMPLRVLPLSRVIASKKAAGRDKDLATLPFCNEPCGCVADWRRVDRRKATRARFPEPV